MKIPLHNKIKDGISNLTHPNVSEVQSVCLQLRSSGWEDSFGTFELYIGQFLNRSDLLKIVGPQSSHT